MNNNQESFALASHFHIRQEEVYGYIEMRD